MTQMIMYYETNFDKVLRFKNEIVSNNQELSTRKTKVKLQKIILLGFSVLLLIIVIKKYISQYNKHYL